MLTKAINGLVMKDHGNSLTTNLEKNLFEWKVIYICAQFNRIVNWVS